MVQQKLLIRFRKTGDLRLVSHRDLARAFERLFRRAGLPLAMSQGFHPHPKINFPSALALGIQGDNEIVEALLESNVDEQSVRSRLVQHCPPGLELNCVRVLDASHPKPRVESMTYQIDVPAERRAAAEQAVHSLLTSDACPWPREGRKQPINLRATIEQLTWQGDRLTIGLRASGEAQARPRDVLAALGLDDLEQQGIWLVRTDVQLANP